MAIRAIVNNNNFPDGGTAIVNGTLPWFNKPVSLTGKSNYNTVAITGIQGGKLWCYTSTGLVLPPIAFSFRASDYSDGVSPSSVFGFSFSLSSTGQPTTMAIFSFGSATMTAAELGVVGTSGSGSVAVIFDRTVAGTQCTFLVNGVFKARKNAGLSYSGYNAITLSVDTTKSGSQGDFSNIYFIDDTQDDTQCTPIINASVMHQYVTTSEPNGWAATNGSTLNGVSNVYMDSIPAYTAPTFNSPAASAKLNMKASSAPGTYSQFYAMETSIHAWRREAATVGKQAFELNGTVKPLPDLAFVGTAITYSMNSGPSERTPDGLKWDRDKMLNLNFSLTPA